MRFKIISTSLILCTSLTNCSFFSDSTDTRAAEYLCALELGRPSRAKSIKIAQASKLVDIEKQLNDLVLIPLESKEQLDRLHPLTMNYAVQGVQPKSLKLKGMPEASKVRSQNKAPMNFLMTKHPEYFDKCRAINKEFLKCNRDALKKVVLEKKPFDLSRCEALGVRGPAIKGFENEERKYQELTGILEFVQKLLKNVTLHRKKTLAFYEDSYWEDANTSADKVIQEFNNLKVDIANSRDLIKKEHQASILIMKLLIENTPSSFAEEHIPFLSPNLQNRETFFQIHFESLMTSLNFEDPADFRSKKIHFSSNPAYFLPLIFLLDQPHLKISPENKAKLTNRSFVSALAMTRVGLLLLKKIGKTVAPIPKLKNTYGHPLVFSTFRKDSLEGLKFFIENGTSAQEVDSYGSPLLAKAVEVENMKKIKFLIGQGAKPSFKEKGFISKSALDVAKDLGNPGMINFLNSVKK